LRAALFAALLCLLPVGVGVQAAPLRVLAAASTVDAMQDVIARFQVESGIAVQLSTAASSRLARQIERGAPADLFLAANETWMDALAAQALLVPGSRRDLLGNRLALLATDVIADPPALTPETDIAALLAGERLVLADPAHVPAGLYAREALEGLGLWDAVNSRSVHAGSARGVVRLLATGQSPLGIAYASDARVSPRVRVGWLFPPGLHRPVVYPVALLARGDRPAGWRLHAFLLAPEAAAIFARHGFRHLPTGTDAGR